MTTEGIIQKVFTNAYIKHGDLNKGFTISEIQTIKKELIAEIKLKFDKPYLEINDGAWKIDDYLRKDILNALIGDNQG